MNTPEELISMIEDLRVAVESLNGMVERGEVNSVLSSLKTQRVLEETKAFDLNAKKIWKTSCECCGDYFFSEGHLVSDDEKHHFCSGKDSCKEMCKLINANLKLEKIPA